jgi:hypothetical protein
MLTERGSRRGQCESRNRKSRDDADSLSLIRPGRCVAATARPEKRRPTKVWPPLRGAPGCRLLVHAARDHCNSSPCECGEPPSSFRLQLLRGPNEGWMTKTDENRSRRTKVTNAGKMVTEGQHSDQRWIKGFQRDRARTVRGRGQPDCSWAELSIRLSLLRRRATSAIGNCQSRRTLRIPSRAGVKVRASGEGAILSATRTALKDFITIGPTRAIHEKMRA